MRFRLDKPEESATKSLIENKIQRKRDANDFGNDIEKISNELNNVIRQYKSMNDLTKQQADRLNNLLAQQVRLKEIIKDASESELSYTKTLQAANDITKDIVRGQKDLQNIQLKNAKTEEERKQIASDTNVALEATQDLLSDIGIKIENNKNGAKSMFDSVASSVKNIKNDIAQLATITGLDNIYNSLSGNKGQIASYNTMRSQFSMSKSDFNQFKRDIMSSVAANGDLIKYGFQDALDYMNRLGELGITDQEMAKEQMDAIMLSTKYLGLSADTQTKILKQARNTGNMDLLNQTNKTMVQIMNAQLGVSRDQLDAIVNQSTNLADLSIMFSGNKKALTNFTASASAIESVYGESAASAAMNIASDLLNRGGSSQYVGVLGENYGEIMAGLQSGDGRALYQILRAVQTSGVAGSGASGIGGWAALSGSGFLDSNTLALYNSSARAGTSYDSAVANIQSSSNNTRKFLDSMQVDFKTMLENVTSWVAAWLPLDSLQTVYYTLAIADMAFGVGRGIFEIRTIMKKELIPGLKDLFSGNKSALDALGNSGTNGTGGKGLLGTTGKMLGTLSIIAGAVMAIGDGVDAISKSDEWGVSKGSAFFGGLLGGTDSDETTRTLKNAMKWALVGAGVGMLVGHPLIGGLLGAALGGALGTIGGENIAQAFNGGSAGAGIAGTSRYSTAMGGGGASSGALVPSSSFPWYFSSPFGYRGSIQTKAGATNPFHNGIDLAAAEGTPIGANNSGIVSVSTTANDGMNYVVVNSGDGYEETYLHLMRPSHLKVGDKVNAGQLIGYMGMTGMATGPHLHFGIRKAGTTDYIDPVNSVTSFLFNPSETGIPGVGVWTSDMDTTGNYTGATILNKMIDADTKSKTAQAFTLEGSLGAGNIVNSVNNGFEGLIKKLEELSARQDSQESMLKMLAQSKGTNIYRY